MKQLNRLVAAAVLAGPVLAQAATLTVDVAGVANAKGKVLVAVYGSADKFLKEPLRTAAVDAQPGKVRLVIAGLPAGDYALSLFHDVNGNGELDANLVGMPTEPYGFSNDAAGHFGPPSFEQARLHLPEAGSVAAVNLR